jgi:hypothetical protein
VFTSTFLQSLANLCKVDDVRPACGTWEFEKSFDKDSVTSDTLCAVRTGQKKGYYLYNKDNVDTAICFVFFNPDTMGRDEPRMVIMFSACGSNVVFREVLDVTEDGKSLYTSGLEAPLNSVTRPQDTTLVQHSEMWAATVVINSAKRYSFNWVLSKDFFGSWDPADTARLLQRQSIIEVASRGEVPTSVFNMLIDNCEKSVPRMAKAVAHMKKGLLSMHKSGVVSGKVPHDIALPVFRSMFRIVEDEDTLQALIRSSGVHITLCRTEMASMPLEHGFVRDVDRVIASASEQGYVEGIHPQSSALCGPAHITNSGDIGVDGTWVGKGSGSRYMFKGCRPLRAVVGSGNCGSFSAEYTHKA